MQKDLRIENLSAAVNGGKGSYNIEPLAIGALVKIHRKSGERIELKEINLSIKNLLSDTPRYY
jgi:hypothetical protein